MRVLQNEWKIKGSRFEKEGKVIAGKTKGIYIKDVGVGGTLNSVCGGGGGQGGTNQVGILSCSVANNKICFKVRVYNVPDNLYDCRRKV